MNKMNKRKYDRGYVDATDKLRVFIESRSKVMFVEHDYAARGMVRVIVSNGELFMIRKDI